MSFVNAHFVTYARDLGFSPLVGAGAFSLIGATAIVGSLLLGHFSDQYGRRRLLAASYQLRMAGFVVVLLSMGVVVPGHSAPGRRAAGYRHGAGGLLLERGGWDHGCLRFRWVRNDQPGPDLRDDVRGDAHRFGNRFCAQRVSVRPPGQLRDCHLDQRHPAGGLGSAGMDHRGQPPRRADRRARRPARPGVVRSSRTPQSGILRPCSATSG